MNVAYRIMACFDRREMVEQEVAKLHGLDVKVFYDDRPDGERKGTSYTQLACMNDVLGKDYTHLVLLQDDILLVDRFGDCIEKLIAAKPMAMWTLFCSRMRREDMSFDSPYAMLFPPNSWGQGNLIPLDMLERILAFRDDKLPNYIYDDGLYIMYAVEKGIPIYTPRVALMQHLCPTNSLLGYNNKFKVSKIWAGEDIFDKVNWDSRDFKRFRIPASCNPEKEYAKYGRR